MPGVGLKQDALHLVTVERDDEDGYIGYDLWHPSTCKTYSYSVHPTQGELRDFDCMTKWEFDAIGLDALLFDTDPPAGVYAIQVWSQWSGSMFDDADGGTDLVRDDLLPRLP